MLWKSKSWTSGLVGALVQTVNKQFPQNGSKWMVSFHTKTSSRCVKPSETSLSLFLAKMLSKSDWTVIQIIRRTFARSAECILWLHIYIYVCIYISESDRGPVPIYKMFFLSAPKKMKQTCNRAPLKCCLEKWLPSFHQTCTLKILPAKEPPWLVRRFSS